MPKAEPDMFSGESHLVPVGRPGEAASVPAVIGGDSSLTAVPENASHPLLPDMRAALMTLPPEQMLVEGARYIESRRTFRDWLRSQLVQGVHFGYPPGIEPKFNDDGDMIQSVKDKQSGQWVKKVVPKESWTAKPSLYKAGADFVCDLLVVRDEYSADMDGWTQLGSPKGVFVYACRLFSRANGDLIGEGRGVRSVGQKGGDENNAIKMAKKSAKVDAVLNAFGLSDLFTQDREPGDHGVREDFEKPPENASAPKPRTRDERQRQPQKQADPPQLTPEQELSRSLVIELFEFWVEVENAGDRKWSVFIAWLSKKAQAKSIAMPENTREPATWSAELIQLCRELLPPAGGDQ